MEKTKKYIILILTIVALSISAHAQTLVKEIPNIEGKEEGDAIRDLEQEGFLPQFYNCFSNEEKYHVILGTQDPKANISYPVGRKIKAGVSLGPIPIVIGLSEDEAKEKLNESNLVPVITIGRNTSFKEGIIYDQYPKDTTCLPINSKINIFVNRSIIIDNPQENDEVPDRITVRGRISSSPKDNEHLWIAVKPETDVSSWWPQINGDGPLEPYGGAFEGNVFLGGIKNDSFQIGILVIDDQLNQKFLEWVNISKNNNTWPPITEGYPQDNIKVSKKDIEDHVAARVNVTLNV